MTPDFLKRTGAALYGRQWQSEMAQNIGVSDRTIRRWASGSAPIPLTISETLMPLCVEHIAELESIFAEMGRLEETLYVRLRAAAIHPGATVTEYRRIGTRFNAHTCTVGRSVTMSRDYRDELRFAGKITGYAEIAVDCVPGEIQDVYAGEDRLAVITIRVDCQDHPRSSETGAE